MNRLFKRFVTIGKSKFTNIADFSKDGDQPLLYGRYDSAYGWNGWLAFDKAVNLLVTKAEHNLPSQMTFFSKGAGAQPQRTPDEFK